MRALTILLLLSLPSCTPRAPNPGQLPPELREVSGLAAASPTSVFAHDDERAVVHEIDLATGGLMRSFALGAPPARGDFEGIAVDRGQVFLITSDGRLLAAPLGADGARVSFEVRDTGAGEDCEIEGLSLAPTPGSLLILCKRIMRGGQGLRLRIHEWRTDGRRPTRRAWLDIDLSGILTEQGGNFAPSAIEWLPRERQLVVISAGDLTLLVLSEDGRLLGRARLSPGRHRQPEGLAATPAGALVIADEGARGRPGLLTVYPPTYLRQVLSRFRDTSSEVRMSTKASER